MKQTIGGRPTCVVQRHPDLVENIVGESPLGETRLRLCQLGFMLSPKRLLELQCKEKHLASGLLPSASVAGGCK
jgi:hypothetical protein